MSKPVQKGSEVWEQIAPFALRKLNEIIGQAKSSDGISPSYVIWLYKAASQKLRPYSVTESGLKAAVAAMSSGDAVQLPACNLAFTGVLTIPAGGALAGLGRESSKINGQITLGAGSALIDVGNIRSVNDANATYGVVGPGSGVAYLQNCKISVTQAGAGSGYALRMLVGNVESAGSLFYGTTAGVQWAGAGLFKSYHDRITAATPFTGGTGSGTYTFDSDYQGWQQDSQGWNPQYGSHTLSIDTVTYHGAPGAIKIVSVGTGNITRTYSGPLLLYLDINFTVHTNDVISLWAKCNSDYAGERVYIKLLYSDGSTRIYDNDPNGSFNWTQHSLTIPVDDNNKIVTRVYFGEYYDGWDHVYNSTWWFDDVSLAGVVGNYSPNALVNGSSFETQPAGTPAWGDRSAYDAATYPLRHADDIDLSSTSIHHTLGGGANQAAPGYHYHHLNKLDATTEPGSFDDSAAGYSVNSVWIDVTNDKVYVCVDATAGAAVWKEYASMVNPMTTAGDIIVQQGSVTKANTDTSGNKVINASPSSTERVIATCDMKILNPVGSITLAWNVWASMNQVGVQKKVTLRIRRDNLSGASLWFLEKTMALDSVAGHDQQWNDSLVDASVTTGRYVLTSQATGVSTVDVYSDTRNFSITGLSNIPARLGAGSEGQVNTILSGRPAWENQFYRGRLFSEDFRANLPSGWAWAASPFVTPPTVTLVDGTILRLTGYTAISRSFLYKAVTTARSYYLLCPVYRLAATNYIGWRIDDGTDNNYIEYYHAPQSDGSFSLLKKTRTGGGAPVETSMKNYAMPLPWITLYPFINGTQWSDWYVDLYLLGSGIPFMSMGTTGAPHFTWTPTRAGFVLSVSAANYLYADVDAWSNA